MRLLRCIFLLTFPLCICAQEIAIDTVETRWDMAKYDFGNVFKGVGYAYSRPLHWQGSQWTDAAIVVGATGTAYLFDDSTSEYMRGIRDNVPKVVRDYGFEYGSPSNNYILTGAVYLTGLVAKDEKLRRTGVLLISSATAAGFLQQVMKSAIGRARPLSGRNKDTYKPLWSGDREFHSFPSGHAILAMTNAHAIAKQFKNKWIKGGIYTLGAIPTVSRLWEGKHWLSDITFSVFVSIFTVEAIDRYLDKKYAQKYNNGTPKKVSYDLNFGPGTFGISMRF